jgi:hypothetical protein
MSLLEAGALDAFDAVYGASAGAINSTYFLSGAWGCVFVWSWGVGGGSRSRKARREAPV